MYQIILKNMLKTFCVKFAIFQTIENMNRRSSVSSTNSDWF